YNVAVVTTILAVATLTLIRILERKFMPSSTKRARRCKIVVYAQKDFAKDIHDYLASVVDNIEDFSTKVLIENPEKVKISSMFELVNKKLNNEIYNKIMELAHPDSLTIQELND
ncbi:hypothetical protein IJO12_08020, partial [bacterium]|nr:hypothetical protein [bacterium]